MFIKEKYDGINSLYTLAVGEYTKGIYFPTNKREILERIKQHNAPKNIEMLITLFQEKNYESSIDVEREEARLKDILMNLHKPNAFYNTKVENIQPTKQHSTFDESNQKVSLSVI